MPRRAAALVWMLAVGCSEARPVEPDRRQCLDWKHDVAPLVAQRCLGCHADFQSYLQLIGFAPRIASALADATHATVSEAAPTLRRWVTDCQLAYERSDVHPGGIMNPADTDFHGTLAQTPGVGLSTCAKCHGGDFAGGAARASCLGCHQKGPTACDTCHGQPPATGAHSTHATRYGCSPCHLVPAMYTDVHLHAPPARMRFAAIAGGQARWDAQMRTCSVSCHGGARPSWTPDPAQAACGSCHGLPPPGHADARCAACHPPADAPTHADGHVDLGDGSGGCAACHGQPPPEGAHLAHALATHRLSAPVACAACHLVPAAVTSAGHIDHAPPATVFPAGLGGPAAADGATPTWDPGAGTCAQVYCHGGGVALASDHAAGLARTPAWSGADQAACGTCHGIPPQDGVHWSAIRLTDCTTCHPTMDASGAIVVPSRHIDGVIDVR